MRKRIDLPPEKFRIVRSMEKELKLYISPTSLNEIDKDFRKMV